MDRRANSSKSFNVSGTHLVIVIAVLVGQWIFNWATLSNGVIRNRQDIVEIQVDRKAENASARLLKLESDLSSQVVRYNQDVVPRSEHMEMNRRLDERLGRMESDISDIKQRFARQGK